MTEQFPAYEQQAGPILEINHGPDSSNHITSSLEYRLPADENMGQQSLQIKDRHYPGVETSTREISYPSLLSAPEAFVTAIICERESVEEVTSGEAAGNYQEGLNATIEDPYHDGEKK